MSTTSNKNGNLLSRNDIIELQRHCYARLVDETVLQGGVEKTLKVGSQISEGSYFDIHKFAELLQEAVIDKLHMQNWLPRKPDGHE